MKGILLPLFITAITGCSQVAGPTSNAPSGTPAPTSGGTTMTEVYTASVPNIGMPGLIAGQLIGTTMDANGLLTTSVAMPFDRAATPTPLNAEIKADGRGLVERQGVTVAYRQNGGLTVQTQSQTRSVTLPQGFWSLQNDLSGGLLSVFRSRLSLNGDLVIVPHPAGLVAYRLQDLAQGRDTPAWTVLLPQNPALKLPGDRPDHQLRSMSVDEASGVTVYAWTRYSEDGHSPTYVSALDRSGKELWSLKAVNPTQEMRSRLVVVGAGEGLAAFHVTGESRLRAVDLLTGQPRWENPDVRCSGSDIFNHVVITSGTVFPVSSGDSCVKALNLDGQTRWTHTGDGRTFGGVPVIHHGVVYAANGQINAIDLKSGQLLGLSKAVVSTQRESSTAIISPDGQFVAAWGDTLGVYRTIR